MSSLYDSIHASYTPPNRPSTAQPAWNPFWNDPAPTYPAAAEYATTGTYRNADYPPPGQRNNVQARVRESHTVPVASQTSTSDGFNPPTAPRYHLRNVPNPLNDPRLHAQNPASMNPTHSVNDPASLESIEFAISDDDLRFRLWTSASLQHKQPNYPQWLNTALEVPGDPSKISPGRIEELRAGRMPTNDDERRFIRNRVAARKTVTESNTPALIHKPFRERAHVEHLGKGDKRRIESARSDTELCSEICNTTWPNNKEYTFPKWLFEPQTHAIEGEPSNVSRKRKGELRNGQPPHNDDELRFIRNRAVLDHIFNEFQREPQGDDDDDCSSKATQKQVPVVPNMSAFTSSPAFQDWFSCRPPVFGSNAINGTATHLAGTEIQAQDATKSANVIAPPRASAPPFVPNPDFEHAPMARSNTNAASTAQDPRLSLVLPKKPTTSTARVVSPNPIASPFTPPSGFRLVPTKISEQPHTTSPFAPLAANQPLNGLASARESAQAPIHKPPTTKSMAELRAFIESNLTPDTRSKVLRAPEMPLAPRRTPRDAASVTLNASGAEKDGQYAPSKVTELPINEAHLPIALSLSKQSDTAAVTQSPLSPKDTSVLPNGPAATTAVDTLPPKPKSTAVHVHKPTAEATQADINAAYSATFTPKPNAGVTAATKTPSDVVSPAYRAWLRNKATPAQTTEATSSQTISVTPQAVSAQTAPVAVTQSPRSPKTSFAVQAPKTKPFFASQSTNGVAAETVSTPLKPAVPEKVAQSAPAKVATSPSLQRDGLEFTTAESMPRPSFTKSAQSKVSPLVSSTPSVIPSRATNSQIQPLRQGATQQIVMDPSPFAGLTPKSPPSNTMTLTTTTDRVQVQRPGTDAEEAEGSKPTFLAPVSKRTVDVDKEIFRLNQQIQKKRRGQVVTVQQNPDTGQITQESASLSTDLRKLLKDGLGQDRVRSNIAALHQSLQGMDEENSSQESESDYANLQQLQQCGTKRKAPPPSPMRLGDDANGNNEHTTAGHLLHLANKISKDLGEAVPNETIQLCGLAPIKLMEERPDDVLALAHQKLHTWPYQHVPTCWRRLYEDASLAKAMQILRKQAEVQEANPTSRTKRARVEKSSSSRAAQTSNNNSEEDWLVDIVKTLDMGISLSGAPGRSATFESVFQQLENHVKEEQMIQFPNLFAIKRPQQLNTKHNIAHVGKPISYQAFQNHLDESATPLIIKGTLTQWPASRKWQDPRYFLRQTLGGRRLVPVEVGKSYTDEDWSQTIMSFREFMLTYVLHPQPKEIGYLAQHDLFAQIPALREDIYIPDYCYTTPPDADAAAARTAGLAAAAQLDQPFLNAWLGPKGTKTPLHTDPYHNILCQVVGYKYVRLYAPSQTQYLYPRGVDEKGISMENTSQVDVSLFRSRVLGGKRDLEALRKIDTDFPLFQQAQYVEAVLAPGECLYVPLGWWHYVESLTTSFSVSFWWN